MNKKNYFSNKISAHHQSWWEQAYQYLVGGVNSPVRAFKQVGGNALIINKGKGAMIEDIDGKRYIDFVNAWGPLLLGHANKSVVQKVKQATNYGLNFGATHKNEILLAKKICEWMPHIEKVRLVNSGTEAVMSAIRLTRAFTRRTKIIAFKGGYHGHSDSVLGKLSLGVPQSTINHLTLCEYNDVKSVEAAFKREGKQIACVIVEPIAGNMGLVKPHRLFLSFLRKVTWQYGALLVFDEVMTGFRLGKCLGKLGKGGVSEHYGVTADITTLGKIIGGGLPVGAYGGKAKFMDLIAPMGNVYQAGTLSGNPIAVIAGLTTLQVIENTKNFYHDLEKFGARLQNLIESQIKLYRLPMCVCREGSMISFFFCRKVPNNYQEVLTASKEHYACFFHLCLQNGIYLPPSPYESCFLSYAHTKLKWQLIEKKFITVFKELSSNF